MGKDAVPVGRLARYCLRKPKKPDCLILLTPLLLAEAFTRKGSLGTTTFPGLHEVTVLFYFLDDVFGLHFPLEATESVLERLTLLNDNFSHAYSPPSRIEYFKLFFVSY